MKKLSLTPAKLLILVSAVLFVIFWSVWFFCYRHYLIWLEGYSFFSTLPDFLPQYLGAKEGIPGYIGAFLHQFYAMPALGAAIQAFLTIWPSACAGIILLKLFRNPKGLLWIVVLPLAYVTYRQYWDLHLYYTVIANIVSTLLMLVAVVVTKFRKPQWNVPEWLSNRFVNYVLTLAGTVLSVYFLTGLHSSNKVHEEYAKLEYLGENHRWKDILETVSPNEAKTNELKRAYVLLALSESGLLADYAFRYGLDGQDDFVFSDKIDPLYLNYNALFYQCLDMHNAVIYQAYQQGVQSVTGVSFSTVRRLADTYIELKDYALAKKYIDILSHSTCHGKWVKERLARLESIKHETPLYEYDEYKATISHFAHTISSMVDRNRNNRKYADLLLCSLLAEEEGEQFKQIFRYIAQTQYPSSTPIPRLYEEALILIAMVDPNAIAGYQISEDTRKRFEDYVGLMNAGRGTQALRKHADTYWAYSY